MTGTHLRSLPAAVAVLTLSVGALLALGAAAPAGALGYAVRRWRSSSTI